MRYFHDPIDAEASLQHAHDTQILAIPLDQWDNVRVGGYHPWAIMINNFYEINRRTLVAMYMS